MASVLSFLRIFFDSSNIWFSVTSLALAVSGLVYSILHNYYQNKKKKPSYWIKTTHLVRDSIKGIKGVRILFNDEEIPNISSTVFVFLNSGKDAIKNTDIASRNPIKITIESQYKILDAFIEKHTNEDNNFKIQLQDDNHSIYINFEFMEYKDGITLRLIHTAPDSNSFTVSGKVIAGEPITRIFYPDSFMSIESSSFEDKVKNNRSNLVLSRFFVIFLGFLLVLAAFKAEANDKMLYYILKGLLLLSGLFYFYLGIFRMRRIIPSSLEIE